MGIQNGVKDFWLLWGLAQFTRGFLIYKLCGHPKVRFVKLLYHSTQYIGVWTRGCFKSYEGIVHICIVSEITETFITSDIMEITQELS